MDPIPHPAGEEAATVLVCAVTLTSTKDTRSDVVMDRLAALRLVNKRGGVSGRLSGRARVARETVAVFTQVVREPVNDT